MKNEGRRLLSKEKVTLKIKGRGYCKNEGGFFMKNKRRLLSKEKVTLKTKGRSYCKNEGGFFHENRRKKITFERRREQISSPEENNKFLSGKHNFSSRK